MSCLRKVFRKQPVPLLKHNIHHLNNTPNHATHFSTDIYMRRTACNRSPHNRHNTYEHCQTAHTGTHQSYRSQQKRRCGTSCRITASTTQDSRRTVESAPAARLHILAYRSCAHLCRSDIAGSKFRYRSHRVDHNNRCYLNSHRRELFDCVPYDTEVYGNNDHNHLC